MLADSVSENASNIPFTILHRDPLTHARRGRLQLKHGTMETPVFMPVGTRGNVRGISAEELETLNSEIMLGNTYHLFERPGIDIIRDMGGLHAFTGWNRNLLTDSGGFQIFSLAHSRKLSDHSVTFRSLLDGTQHELTPERVVQIQEIFGSDIMMMLDECPPAHANYDEVKWAVERTTKWAARGRASQTRDDLQLFPIVQGGIFEDLRRKSLDEIMALESREQPWKGLAIGGLSVGEDKKDFVRILYEMRNWLPEEKPHYLMGVGTPRDLVFGVACGIDMFDCVLPSRNGRHGIVMTRKGRMNLINAKFQRDEKPIDESCSCSVCGRHSRAFLRHLFQVGDTLGGRLATLHNIAYFLDLMRDIRLALDEGRFAAFMNDFLAQEDQIFLGGEKTFGTYPSFSAMS